MIRREEFVVHLFAPLDGPHAEDAYQQLRRIWQACRCGLAMTLPVDGIVAPAELPAQPPRASGGSAIAAAQTPDTGPRRQVVVRQVHDVLNVSVALGQADPGTPAEPSTAQPDWSSSAELWDEACSTGTDALLAETRLLLAVADLPASGGDPAGLLADAVRSRLPADPAGSPGWWFDTSSAWNFRAWDVGSPLDVGRLRELVIVAPAGQEAELSTLAWSDGGENLPPLGRYLLHAAKLRYQLRLLAAWHAADRGARAASAAWSSSPSRLRQTDAELQRMRHTCEIVRANLAAGRLGPGRELGLVGPAFDRDTSAGEWLTTQIEDELVYLRIDLDAGTAAAPFAQDRPPERAAWAELAPVRQPQVVAGRLPAGTAESPSGEIFVIYAHEDEAHKQAVLALTNFLREDCGIPAEMDRYWEGGRRSWSKWARTRIFRADFVVVIASPICRDVLEEDYPSHLNQGIYEELSFLDELLARDRAYWEPRVLPIVLTPRFTRDDVPLFLRPHVMDWYAVSDLTEAGAADLLATLRGRPEHPRPPLGCRTPRP